MKILSGALVILLMFYISPVHGQAARATGPSPLDPVEIGAIGVFSHANSFHSMVLKRQCDPADAGRIKSINQRLERARKRLAARFGEKVFPAGRTYDWAANGFCDAMTVESYGMHVTEVEKYMIKNSIK